MTMVPSLFLILTGTVISGFLAYQGADIKRFTARFQQDAPPTSIFSVALMNERFASELAVVQPATHQGVLAAARQQVDATSGPALASARGRAATDPTVYTQAVQDLGRGVSQLTTIRSRVDAGRASLLDVDQFYSPMIAAVTKSLFLIARSEPVPKAAVGFVQSVAIFEATDAWIDANGLALAAAIGPGLSQAEFRRYADTLGGARTIIDQTVPLFDEQTAKGYRAMLASPAWTTLAAAHDAILQRGPIDATARHGGQAATAGTAGTANTAGTADLPDEKTWTGDTLQVLGQFGGLGTKFTQGSAAISGDQGQRQLIQWVLLGVALLVLAVIILVITTLASRQLIRRLQRLREETLVLSNDALPRIVERMRSGEPVDVAAELPPLHFGSDEIGQVADAFGQAQRQAVAAATREAETRAGLRTVFLDIAHRNQAIIYRQLKVLDQAERTQEDPDQLSLLFQLDHLATRARRNAENLIILGGGQAGRQWRNPVPLLDLVRSAISEAEDYIRVTVAGLPRVSVNGAAVGDLIHLVAELVDNATSFSPPMSRVEVRGNLVGRGLVVEIEDQGLGMDQDQIDQLNAMLHDPPDFQVMALADEPRLGLFVVAQLAARHDVRVTLTPSPAYGGTRAVVLIPAAVLLGDQGLPMGAEPAALPSAPGVQYPEVTSPTTAVAPQLSNGQPADWPPSGPVPLLPVRSAPEQPLFTPAPGLPLGDLRPTEPTPPPAPATLTAPPTLTPAPMPPSTPTPTSMPLPLPLPPPGPTPPAPTPMPPASMQAPPPAPMQAPPPAPMPSTPMPSTHAPATYPPARPEPAPAPASLFTPQPSSPAPADDRRHVLDRAERVMALLTDPTLAEPPVLDGRPELPRRNRQAHLSPRLRHAPEPDDASPTATDPGDADQVRSRMSALQRGTMRGRAADPEPPR
jgi:hypothetical protein